MIEFDKIMSRKLVVLTVYGIKIYFTIISHCVANFNESYDIGFKQMSNGNG